MGLAIDKKWFANIRKYKEEIAICQFSDPPILLGIGNVMSLEPLIFAAKEAENFIGQLWSVKWPKFVAFVNARYNAKMHQIEAAILFLYKQISKAKAAKERIIINKEE